MAAPTPPSRRLPARVYWVRRVLVLAVALGMVFGVARLLDGGDPPSTDVARAVGAEPRTAPAASPRATGDPAPDSGRSNRAKSGRTSGPAARKTVTPLPEPTGPCRDSDVVATPRVRDTAYAGGPVTFRIKLTSVESPACTWRVSPEKLAVKLVSGSDRIWSSQDCPRAVPPVDVIVRQEEPAKVDVVWHGQRSDSTCSRTTAWAQPGWYHVQAAAFGGEPSDVQFELRPPVPATITPKPKPEPEPKSNSKSKPHEKKADGTTD